MALHRARVRSDRRKVTSAASKARRRERLALVTGSSSGVGRAVAIELSRAGFGVLLTGRSHRGLAATESMLEPGSHAGTVIADLARDVGIRAIARRIADLGGDLHALVHSAGIIHQGTMSRARVETLDTQFALNLRAPWLLTKALLPALERAQGAVVFVNSSVGLTAMRADIGQYAATKHALKAIADSLRAEVNPLGVRVLSVYLGRTATPMQQALARKSRQPYRVEALLQPEDVALMVRAALTLPPTAEVTDLMIRPRRPPAS